MLLVKYERTCDKRNLLPHRFGREFHHHHPKTKASLMKVLTVSLLFFTAALHPLLGVDLIMQNSKGGFVHIDAAVDATVDELRVLAELKSQEPFFMYGESPTAQSYTPRSFEQGLSARDEADIRYIVTTLSDVSTPRLLFFKSSLDDAGDRIHHVHPLNFLGLIFSDTELRVKVRNIKAKSWVWKTFMSGLKTSLNEEYAKQNLLPEYYASFSERVGIDQRKIDDAAQNARWDDMVNILIKFVTRQSGADRYKM